jgi:predicted enzyme related to lactoylglutathione lyase
MKVVGCKECGGGRVIGIGLSIGIGSRTRRAVLIRTMICALIFMMALAATLTPSLAASQSGEKNGLPADGNVAVGPQYNTTHVYVVPADLDAFVGSFVATFGGKPSKRIVGNVTPVASSTEMQYILSPVGALSIFAYQTAVPFPYGQERTGYLVNNMDAAVKAARAAGAEIIVEPFKDPIGMDAVIQWPGGVKMQLYLHFTPPTNPPLESVPENRVYVSRDEADHFVSCFVRFAHGKVLGDDRQADAGEIGRAGEAYRRLRITSLFGSMLVLVTDGHLPYPFGLETTGYQVQDLGATLTKAKAAGVKVLTATFSARDRSTAIVEFPGGYKAEVHEVIPPKSPSQSSK